jgi:hypothetical protein
VARLQAILQPDAPKLFLLALLANPISLDFSLALILLLMARSLIFVWLGTKVGARQIG